MTRTGTATTTSKIMSSVNAEPVRSTPPDAKSESQWSIELLLG